MLFDAFDLDGLLRDLRSQDTLPKVWLFGAPSTYEYPIFTKGVKQALAVLTTYEPEDLEIEYLQGMVVVAGEDQHGNELEPGTADPHFALVGAKTSREAFHAICNRVGPAMHAVLCCRDQELESHSEDESLFVCSELLGLSLLDYNDPRALSGEFGAPLGDEAEFRWTREGVWQPTIRLLEELIELNGEIVGTAIRNSRQLPIWDESTRELSLDGEIVRRLSGQAHLLTDVLNRFQKAGWAERITLPESKFDNSRIASAVTGLNKGSNGLRFARDGTGKGIRWRRES